MRKRKREGRQGGGRKSERERRKSEKRTDSNAATNSQCHKHFAVTGFGPSYPLLGFSLFEQKPRTEAYKKIHPPFELTTSF